VTIQGCASNFLFIALLALMGCSETNQKSFVGPPEDSDLLILERLTDSPSLRSTGFSRLGACSPPSELPPTGEEWLELQQFEVTAEWSRRPLRLSGHDEPFSLPFEDGDPVVFTSFRQSESPQFDLPPSDEPVYWFWGRLELEAAFDCPAPVAFLGGWKSLGRFGQEDVDAAIEEYEEAGGASPFLSTTRLSGHYEIEIEE